MLFDDAPEPIFVWHIGRTLVHEHGGGIGQWTVNHVAVTGNPSAVGGAKVNVRVFQVKNQFAGGKRSR